MLSTGKDRAESLAVMRRKLEFCQALEVPVLVVPTDFPQREVVRADYDRAAEGLAEAADVAAAYDVCLAVEFIKGAKLVATLRTALDLVRKTGKQNVGILLDTFHLWAGASDMRDVSELAAKELLLVHVNDVRPVPPEIAEDKDRVLPGDGIMPVREILQAVARTGYRGFCSVELFDECLWQEAPGEVAQLAFEKTSSLIERVHDA
jgi:2-keto-myo-inositol isomerase